MTITNDTLWDEITDVWEDIDYVYPPPNTNPKEIIELYIYQVGNQVLTTPKLLAFTLSSIRDTIRPIDRGGNLFGNTGQIVSSRLIGVVNSTFSIVNPSNSSITDYFTNSDVLTIIDELN